MKCFKGPSIGPGRKIKGAALMLKKENDASILLISITAIAKWLRSLRYSIYNI